MKEDYEDIWELVKDSVDISREEFDNLVNRVYEKAANFINKRAAAIIVARDLGVDTSLLMYPPIRGRILEVGPIKYSKSPSGGETPYVLFTLVNEDDRLLCVAFGTHHIERLRMLEDKPIEIRRYTKARLRKYTMIKVTEGSEIRELDESAIPPITDLEKAWAKRLDEMKNSPGSFIAKGVVIDEQVTEFFACPECGKSLDIIEDNWYCPEHGFVEPNVKKRYRYLLSDKSGVFPAVYFGEINKPSILNKLIVFKGYMRNSEIQISKIYSISEEEIL